MPQEVPQPSPALARATLDRAADERADDGLLPRLRTDLAAVVLAVHGDRAPIGDDGALRYVTPDEVDDAAQWAFLGRRADGAPVLLAASPVSAPAPVDHALWGSLRAVGGALSDEDAGAFVEAVSLGGWLVDAPFCPACGQPTTVHAAGWARRCRGCGREHFPRTDPAVIVAVTDPTGERLLLGKNERWASRNMYSTFAGFVEAGESLEAAVAREVFEEAGVVLRDLRYRGSQSWPYPRSLMLGFHTVATDPASARPDGEEILDVRWFDRDEIGAALAGGGDVGLPGAASIAHRLIVDWHAS